MEHPINPETTPEQLRAQLHAVAARGAAVRVTRPDWRLGKPPKKTNPKKARRQQQAASRKRNR